MTSAGRIVRWIRQLFLRKEKAGTNNRPSKRRSKKQWSNRMKIKGTVKFFNHDKGFGFIKFGGKDIFVHATQVNGGAQLNEGDEVEFTVGQNAKGEAAEGVELLNKANSRSDEPSTRGQDARY